VVWLVSFILLQVIISLTLRGALKNSLKAVLAGESGSEAPLREQISALDALERYDLKGEIQTGTGC
ncbi:MAG: hypothetical protein LLG44_04265, partial [Chloroflexi bacterium]|nr:hypothetical protein [Chloroflexota bacterium]